MRPELGQVDFPTSGAADAQGDFLTGVLLLHSFEYDDAAAAFRAAEKRDPGFAMAYWGEAMSSNHPIWHELDADSARAALGRLAPTPEARLARAPSEREKGYLRAVEALFGSGKGGDKASRDRDYAAAMRRLHEAFPDDLEAASFYALALLGSCENGRDIPTYMQAAAVVEEVFARNPRHPGAAHYLIHAYDDPVHAPLGLRAARAYAQIAPAAAHALHMPSHIFLALGMWDETAAANEASWAASDERRNRLHLALEERGYHALQWLAYAYLQQGRFRQAQELLATMERDTAQTGSRRTRSHLALMSATHLVETRPWLAVSGPPKIDLSRSDLAVEVAAGAYFTRGLAALGFGGPDGEAAARLQLQSLTALLAPGAAAGIRPAGPAGHSAHASPASLGGSSQSAGPNGLDQGVEAARIMRDQLDALLQLAAGQHAAAVNLLDSAARAEDAMRLDFGPPVVVKPSHELAGEVLLGLGRAADARRHFEQALARAPRRSLSLLGLARAAARSGDGAAARQAYAELRRNWRRADPDLAEQNEVAAGAGAPVAVER
ncbi:MAG TPA: hypothetical protein VHR45_12565 [Thermoanaerobaculia bacterium]|nr:hypothetical protein [Thermoanaerobaculia bacterium]